MINLDEQRKDPLWVVEIRQSFIQDVDLTTVQVGDWMEGFGELSDYGIVGFLKQAGRLGLCLAKRTTVEPG